MPGTLAGAGSTHDQHMAVAVIPQHMPPAAADDDTVAVSGDVAGAEQILGRAQPQIGRAVADLQGTVEIDEPDQEDGQDDQHERGAQAGQKGPAIGRLEAPAPGPTDNGERVVEMPDQRLAERRREVELPGDGGAGEERSEQQPNHKSAAHEARGHA